MNSVEQVVTTVDLNDFAKQLKLEIVYQGRGSVTLATMSVERPGLPLAGFFDYYDTTRIVVIGLAEYEYLRTFSVEERREKLSKLFRYGEVPCVILSRSLVAYNELLEAAKSYGCPILVSPKETTDLMSDLYIYLNRLLAPSCSEHGVLLEVFGVGILLTGKSGVGKSETAVELIKRGHRLVADDSVIIKEIANELYGTCPEKIRYFMELRGIGIINVKSMYGSGSILDEKKIELVIELENRLLGKDYDRIGDKEESMEYLGISVPKITIPVSPGRNLAIIIEVAARKERLKRMGYDASQELIEQAMGKM
jgi:HPr kinase/phosphorylase